MHAHRSIIFSAIAFAAFALVVILLLVVSMKRRSDGWIKTSTTFMDDQVLLAGSVTNGGLVKLNLRTGEVERVSDGPITSFICMDWERSLWLGAKDGKALVMGDTNGVRVEAIYAEGLVGGGTLIENDVLFKASSGSRPYSMGGSLATDYSLIWIKEQSGSAREVILSAYDYIEDPVLVSSKEITVIAKGDADESPCKSLIMRLEGGKWMITDEIASRNNIYRWFSSVIGQAWALQFAGGTYVLRKYFIKDGRFEVVGQTCPIPYAQSYSLGTDGKTFVAIDALGKERLRVRRFDLVSGRSTGTVVLEKKPESDQSFSVGPGE